MSDSTPQSARSGLGPEVITAEHLREAVGQVISDAPYVKLLSTPRWTGGRWEALAQVDCSLAVIELTMREVVKANAE